MCALSIGTHSMHLQVILTEVSRANGLWVVILTFIWSITQLNLWMHKNLSTLSYQWLYKPH